MEASVFISPSSVSSAKLQPQANQLSLVRCGGNGSIAIQRRLELFTSSTSFYSAFRRSERINETISRKPCPYKINCSVANEPVVLQASSIHETYDKLAQRLLAAASTKSDDKYLVGIAGPPGAGKSTLVREVAARVNRLWQQKRAEGSSGIAIAVPMDGFHLYRHQLDAMEDPAEAHARRGAPWTFNPSALFDCLSALRTQKWAYFPSFDHGVGDPVEQDILVASTHNIVLVEGNYLLLDEGDWKKIADLFDERWFIMIDTDRAMQRVEQRHIATGLCYCVSGKTKEVARQRVYYNDRPNAEMIQRTKGRANLIVNSIDYSAVQDSK